MAVLGPCRDDGADRVHLHVPAGQPDDIAPRDFLFKGAAGGKAPAQPAGHHALDRFDIVDGPDIGRKRAPDALHVDLRRADIIDLPLALKGAHGQGLLYLRQPVMAGADRAQHLGAQIARGDVQGDRRRQRQRKVDIAVAQIVPQRRQRGIEELDPRLRMRGGKDLQRPVQVRARKQHIDQYPQPGFLALFQRGGMRGKTARGLDQTARLGQQGAAPLGQVRAAGPLAQQRKAALRLKLGQRIADRRDRPAQGAGGAGQAALIDDGAKGGQVIDKVGMHAVPFAFRES